MKVLKCDCFYNVKGNILLSLVSKYRTSSALKIFKANFFSFFICNHTPYSLLGRLVYSVQSHNVSLCNSKCNVLHKSDITVTESQTLPTPTSPFPPQKTPTKLRYYFEAYHVYLHCAKKRRQMESNFHLALESCIKWMLIKSTS